VKAGREPACVTTCIGKSRIFGDIEDPESEVSILLLENHSEVLKIAAGTEPRVYYINRII
jgi:Fe-S-cluster-containing dehydrogenase component